MTDEAKPLTDEALDQMDLVFQQRLSLNKEAQRRLVRDLRAARGLMARVEPELFRSAIVATTAGMPSLIRELRAFLGGASRSTGEAP